MSIPTQAQRQTIESCGYTEGPTAADIVALKMRALKVGDPYTPPACDKALTGSTTAYLAVTMAII